MRLQTGPVTPLGITVLCIAAFGFVFGWVFGWIELVVLATACALAFAMALPFVIGKVQLETTRQLRRNRVLAGDLAHTTLTFTNTRSIRSRRRHLRDLMRSLSTSWTGERAVVVPSLAGGATESTGYDLPALGRGCYEVGPAVISRTDPLQLMRRDIVHTGADQLWVHPRYDPVNALPVGFAKDLEGPTSDTSPVGDVAFHSLREYSTGDDFRHIHWMSTARTGRAMVRHHVDNRKPHLAVLVDTSSSRIEPKEFEVAAEVAASLAVSSTLHREPFTMWAGQTIVAGYGRPPDREAILDALSLVSIGDDEPLADTALKMVRSERGISAVAIITGGSTGEELLDATIQIRRRARPIVVRVWPTGAIEQRPIPRVRVIDIDSRESFVNGWAEVVR